MSSAHRSMNWYSSSSYFRSPVRRAPRCTILYETNSGFSATAQHVAARRACPARLQRPESPLRKRPSRPVHFLSLAHHHPIRASAAGILAHREWQSYHLVLSRGYQRHDSEHAGPKQFPVTGHTYDRIHHEPRNGQRYHQHSKRKLRQSRLHQRRNHQGPHPDHHVATSPGRSISQCNGIDPLLTGDKSR